jgi:hypothetical protein
MLSLFIWAFKIITGSVHIKWWGHRIDAARCRPIEKRVNLRPSTASSIKMKFNSGPDIETLQLIARLRFATYTDALNYHDYFLQLSTLCIISAAIVA